jgi:hypothetical protein
MSRLSTDTSRAARIALALTAFGFVWLPLSRQGSPLPPGETPFESGYNIGKFVVGPMLPWIAAVAFAIASIVKDGGTRRWPAFVALGIISLCVLAAIPTSRKQHDIDAMIRGGSEQIPALVSSLQRLDAAAMACDSAMAGSEPCTLEQIKRMPQLTGLNVRVGRNCTVAGQVCIDVDEQGRTYVEVLSQPIPVAGILRMELVHGADGSPLRAICRSMDPSVSVDMARRTCGTQVEVLPAPSATPQAMSTTTA